MSAADLSSEPVDDLPRWSVTDLHEGFESRSFLDAMERAGADVDRLVALFDEHGIRATTQRSVTPADGESADVVIREYNRVSGELDVLCRDAHLQPFALRGQRAPAPVVPRTGTPVGNVAVFALRRHLRRTGRVLSGHIDFSAIDTY